MAHRQGSVRGWWNSTVEWNQRCRIGTLGGACERRKSQPGSWQPAAISMLQCELLKDFLLMSRLVKRQAADAVVDPVQLYLQLKLYTYPLFAQLLRICTVCFAECFIAFAFSTPTRPEAPPLTRAPTHPKLPTRVQRPRVCPRMTLRTLVATARSASCKVYWSRTAARWSASNEANAPSARAASSVGGPYSATLPESKTTTRS